MRKRAAHHYLNVNDRINNGYGRIKNEKPAICFNEALLGVIGNIKGKDIQN